MSGFAAAIAMPGGVIPAPLPAGSTPPLITADGFALWADARIDNRSELLQQLEIPPSAGAGTDEQIILAAYRRWGESGTEKLIGDFAFALWDPRPRILLCARDHLGIRPFYYCHRQGEMFAFASDLRALLAIPGLSYAVNEEMVGDYLARLSIERSATFYSEVSRLPAAHSLSLRDGSLLVRRYWSLSPDRELRLGSDAEYAEVFRETFEEAVRCRLHSDSRPVAAALSGGLDSSSIVSTARKLLRGGGRLPLHTYSVIFPGLPLKQRKRADERRFVEQVIAGGALQPHFIEGDRLSPFEDFEEVMEHQAEPHYAPNLYLHRGMFGAAASDGARVFLDGLDGDSAVSDGIDRLEELARSLSVRELFAEASALSRRSASKPGAWKVAWEYGFSPVWRAMMGARLRPRPAAVPSGIINRDFARRIHLQDRLAAAVNAPRGSTFRARHIEALESPAHQMGLESFHRCAAAFGLEPRFPFFDRRLLELSVAMPSSQKLRDGWPRLILRRAMEGNLPSAVQWRFTKADLSASFLHGLAHRDRELVETTVRQPPGELGEFVDLGALRRRFERFTSRSAAAAPEALDLYGAVVLAHWLRNRVPAVSRARHCPATA